MKKPIVGSLSLSKDRIIWHLPNDIQVYQSGVEGVVGDRYRIMFGDEVTSWVSKNMAQELFQVILYPPGSEISPEPAWDGEGDDIKHRDKMADINSGKYDETIPRYDIKDNR